MLQRRDVLKQALALGVSSALPLHGMARAGGIGSVRTLRRRDETILRLPSIGDGYKMT